MSEVRDYDLTARQSKVLEWLRKHSGDRPSLRETSRAFGVHHHAIYGHVKALARKGYLTVDAKGIRLTEDRTCPHCGGAL